MDKIDTQMQINTHDKAICVLKMISKFNERFEYMILNYNGIYGNQKDYDRAILALAAKQRLIIYYSNLIGKNYTIAFEFRTQAVLNNINYEQIKQTWK